MPPAVEPALQVATASPTEAIGLPKASHAAERIAGPHTGVERSRDRVPNRGLDAAQPPSPTASTSDGAVPTTRWWDGYTRRLVVTDTIAVLVASGAAYFVRFGGGDTAPTVAGDFELSYAALTVAIAACWSLSLSILRTRHRRIIGSGPQEYTRVFKASWRLFAVIAVLAYLAKMGVGRGYLAIAFPLGLALLLYSRLAWRQWLKRGRARGQQRSSMLIVGHSDTAEELIVELNARPDAGYAVVGVCIPAGEVPVGSSIAGAPVLGGLEDVVSLSSAMSADTVAVTGSDQLTAAVVRRLGWDLEPTGTDLVLATALTDVAGPRIVMTPVNGLPLVHVDAPRFTGGKYVVKSMIDWCMAVVITACLAPMLAVVAILVKRSGPGPVFFRQERVGLNGESFRVFKFRTMHVDAEFRLDEVIDGEFGPFYKRKDDPRVTPVGRTLRRYSIDELPQLFNVLRGEMSLVGPRPQIAREVALYDREAHRRLLVKPGLTGLWQVSGRSQLSRSDAIRKDVYYVENWSIFGDLAILVRTVRAVVGGDGAY